MKEIDLSYDINPLIKKRWSGRAFDGNKLLTSEQILSLCEAARWAPSSMNECPWNYIICDKNSNKSAFDTAWSCLDEWNQRWVKNTSVLFICIASLRFKKNNKENKWAFYDCGAASENICLQAVELGLMAHQIGGFSTDKIIEKFDIPDDKSPISIIAVGYSGNPGDLDEDHFKLEQKTRSRKSLSSNFFNGSFKNPF